MKFTKEQQQIFDFVQTGQGHGIIDAVAGAGKTTTIMECARYVEDQRQVLFCAFNNSIAAEIARKFYRKGMHGVTVKTIHALGRQILKSNNSTGVSIKLENRKYRTLLNSKELQPTLKPYYDRIIRLNGLNPEAIFDDRQKFAVKNLIARIHNRLLDINQKYRATLTKETLADFRALVIHFGIFNSIEVQSSNFQKELLCYYECTKILLKAGNDLSERKMIIDFTDMLYLPYHWGLSPVTRFDFLFIDECQDLSKAQFAVAAKYGKRGGRILAVGDPRQSIYGFTGADIDSFERVRQFTKATQLPLTTCFRCPRRVIEIAQTIRPDITASKQDEGIVKTIKIHQVAQLARPGDLVISRLKAPLVILVFDFIDKNIKVQIHEEEAQEFINELKTIFKQEELNARIASVYGGFGRLKETVQKRWKWIIAKKAERIVHAAERRLYIMHETEYLKQRLEFLHKKYELWKNDCTSVYEVLKKIKLFISAKEKSVRLSSIHRAKGLEEDRIFIIDYDKLPYVRIDQKDWERIQEINLKYVAVTRARSALYLVESPPIMELKKEGSLFDDLPF